MTSRFLLPLFVLLFGSAIFTACSSPSLNRKVQCEERDWYELGRRDGAQGTPEAQVEGYSKDCRNKFSSDFATIYNNGRNAGLVEYCTPENAFELGRMGIAYMYVCPSTVETSFLSSYRAGQRARELELENKKLDGRIDNLSEQIQQSGNEFDRRRLTAEITELQSQRNRNEREIHKTYSKRQ